MLTIVAYSLGLLAALIGGLLGILLTGAAMFRLRSYNAATLFGYEFQPLAPGGIGVIQRAFVGIGRAASALGLARWILTLFGERLTLAFAGLVLLSFVAMDWCLIALKPGGQAPSAQGDPSTVNQKALVLAMNALPTILVAWLFLRR